jgi:hypothetical protein
MSIQRVLIDGVLKEVVIGHEVEIAPTASGHHVVNLGAPVLLVARFASRGCVNVGLRFGGTAVLQVSSQPPCCHQQTILVFEPLSSALNFTEQVFTSEVRQILGVGFGNETTTTIEGAAPLISVAARCSTRTPAHPSEVILSMTDVNSFDDVRGEKLCVAKKSSKPRSLQSCPKIDDAVGIDVIARRAAGGEATWKQCAASFSTMMRHFQRAPLTFKWEADGERRTIITTTLC